MGHTITVRHDAQDFFIVLGSKFLNGKGTTKHVQAPT
jgi:hypothetical protein